MVYNPRQPDWYDLQGPPAPTTNAGGGGGGGGRGGGFGGSPGWWNPFRNATFQGRALFPRQNVAYGQNQANQTQDAFANATVTPTDPRAGFHDAEYWRNYYANQGAAQPTASGFPARNVDDRGPMAPKGGNPVNDMMGMTGRGPLSLRGRIPPPPPGLGPQPLIGTTYGPWATEVMRQLLGGRNPRTEKRVVRQ
jgi:hypothetical protein